MRNLTLEIAVEYDGDQTDFDELLTTAVSDRIRMLDGVTDESCIILKDEEDD